MREKSYSLEKIVMSCDLLDAYRLGICRAA